MKSPAVRTAFVAAAAVVLTVSAQSAYSAVVKLRPIVPQGNVATTDEQQAILAVRAAKASVVSIVSVASIVEGDGQPASGTPRTVENAYASGFVIEPGYVVTNSHAVSDANTDYYVELTGGARLLGKVVGVDKQRDIGLLKVDGLTLAPLAFGTSANLETGQTVFAIGNSLGRYQNTVTRGVVSGLGRNVDPSSDGDPHPRLLNLVQTDAAINPGNSGGPLVNLLGEVVGMNTLIDTAGESLGFAIPSETVRAAAAELKATGQAARPFLGVQYSTITTNVRAAQRLNSDAQGAFIIRAADGSPAAQAGLQPGDIIVAVNRQVLSEQRELDQVLAQFQAGNQVMLTVLRGADRLDLPVILGLYK